MRINKKNKIGASKIWMVIACVLIIFISYVYAAPSGVGTVTPISNSTKITGGAGTIINSTGNDTVYANKAGGFIYTVNLDGEAQNSRWKAYVGNITSTFVLDDSDGYTIFDWSLTTAISGEVYASRASSINW
ncbi:MAG: hypothetical protein U9O94_06955, partial [Nanoarchaeota archaeon]|nr:hypothetical protein [Nanoarchaeota archaeon]